jgi:hypothetical protein
MPAWTDAVKVKYIKRIMTNCKVNDAVLSAFKNITYDVNSDMLRIKSVSAVLSSFVSFLENLVC